MKVSAWWRGRHWYDGLIFSVNTPQSDCGWQSKPIPAGVLPSKTVGEFSTERCPAGALSLCRFVQKKGHRMFLTHFVNLSVSNIWMHVRTRQSPAKSTMMRNVPGWAARFHSVHLGANCGCGCDFQGGLWFQTGLGYGLNIRILSIGWGKAKWCGENEVNRIYFVWSITPTFRNVFFLGVTLPKSFLQIIFLGPIHILYNYLHSSNVSKSFWLHVSFGNFQPFKITNYWPPKNHFTRTSSKLLRSLPWQTSTPAKSFFLAEILQGMN